MSEIKEVFDKMHIELPDGALELLNLKGNSQKGTLRKTIPIHQKKSGSLYSIRTLPIPLLLYHWDCLRG